jgi:hypothetical protein
VAPAPTSRLEAAPGPPCVAWAPPPASRHRAAPGAPHVPVAPVPTSRLKTAPEPPYVAWAPARASWCRVALGAPHVPVAPGRMKTVEPSSSENKSSHRQSSIQSRQERRRPKSWHVSVMKRRRHVSGLVVGHCQRQVGTSQGQQLVVARRPGWSSEDEDEDRCGRPMWLGATSSRRTREGGGHQITRRDQHREQEEPVDGRSFVMKKRRICRPAMTKCKEKIVGREKTLISGSVYHVMNNTYIHLRTKGSHIYMYRRGRIYKEPPEEIQ